MIKRELIDLFIDSFSKKQFFQLSFTKPSSSNIELLQLTIKPVLIKQKLVLSFNKQIKNQAFVKNLEIKSAVSEIENLLNAGSFEVIRLITYEKTHVWTFKKKWLYQKHNSNITETPIFQHNKVKNSIMQAKDMPYLQKLGISDGEGNVFKKSQDKYKQIINYINTINPFFEIFNKHQNITLYDMGSGKGYLTFALYDYLKHKCNFPIQMIGVECRQELVTLCNQISDQVGFNGLSFLEGDIDSLNEINANIIIALHACNTATDDAIITGLKANADLIVVAPCCHQQLRQACTKENLKEPIKSILQYGTFAERQFEMLTDGIRALVLNYFGYETKVLEFVSDAHTPKNVLIIATKKKNVPVKKNEIIQKIFDILEIYSIKYHYLVSKLGITPLPIK